MATDWTSAIIETCFLTSDLSSYAAAVGASLLPDTQFAEPVAPVTGHDVAKQTPVWSGFLEGTLENLLPQEQEKHTFREDKVDMLLMIDNYDSFTYNLVQYLGELGEDVHVHRNDEITVEDIERMNPQRIVVSPGPCTPNEAGVSVSVIQAFSGRVPILGVCLGHQSVGQAFGGKIVHAGTIMHGKTSAIRHETKGVFRGLPNPLTATRYHSLVIDRGSLPDCLEVTAHSDDGEIMGVRHKELPVEGVQFHPESVLSEAGHDMLKNFLTEERI